MFKLWTSIPVDVKWHSCGSQWGCANSLWQNLAVRHDTLWRSYWEEAKGHTGKVKKCSTDPWISSFGACFLRAQLQQYAEDELTQNWKVDSYTSAVFCWGYLSLILQQLSYLASRSFRCCSSDINQPLIGFGIKSTLRYWIFFSGFWSLLLMKLDTRLDRPFSKVYFLYVLIFLKWETL